MADEPNIIVSCDPAGIIDSREMMVYRAWETIGDYTHLSIRRFDGDLYGQIGTGPNPQPPPGIAPNTLVHSMWLTAYLKNEKERAIAIILEHEPKVEFVGRITGCEIFVDKADMTW